MLPRNGGHGTGRGPRGHLGIAVHYFLERQMETFRTAVGWSCGSVRMMPFYRARSQRPSASSIRI